MERHYSLMNMNVQFHLMYVSLPTNTSIPVDEAIQISADRLLNLYVLKTVMVQMILSLILPTILIKNGSNNSISNTSNNSNGRRSMDITSYNQQCMFKGVSTLITFLYKGLKHF